MVIDWMAASAMDKAARASSPVTAGDADQDRISLMGAAN